MRLRSTARAVLLAVALTSGSLAAPVAVVAMPTDAHAQAMSVVYVDVDKVINDCDEGKDAAEALKKEQAKRQTEIQAREVEIKKLQDDLEKQAKAFSAAAIEKKAAHYQQAVVEYQSIVVKYNKELQDKERDLFDPIERRIKELLRTIALRDGYDMILNKRSVPYGRKDLDLTEKVTQEYNKTYPSKGPKADDKKPAPKKPAPTAPKK
ncbi:MAG: OmpH family outer membrane protein [Deltaproteobacteria bacterium]|nr:OmpH family outer membrane protein [Deltaproteobacteria bacterium]